MRSDSITTPPATPPSAPRRRKRATRGSGLYESHGVYTLDCVFRGFRLCKRYPRGLPIETIRTLAQRDVVAHKTAILTTGKPVPKVLPVTEMLVSAALTKFEREHFAHLRPRTREVYRRLLRPLREHLGDLKLTTLSPLDLERYRRARVAGTSGQTGFNREVSLLGTVIEAAKTWGVLPKAHDNPTRQVKRFREHRREVTLSYEQEAALLRELPEPAKTAVQLALESGARLQSELLSLQWSEVDLDKARFTITSVHSKNGRPRTLPMSPPMVERLRAMRAADPTATLVFRGQQGGYYFRFKHVFWAALKRAGLRGLGLGVHTLRHSWASRLAESGCDLVLLQALGGWSSLALVSRHSHARADRGAQALAAMLAARPVEAGSRTQTRSALRGGRRTS